MSATWLGNSCGVSVSDVELVPLGQVLPHRRADRPLGAGDEDAARSHQLCQGRGSVSEQGVEEDVVVAAVVEERAAHRSLEHEPALLGDRGRLALLPGTMTRWIRCCFFVAVR